MSDARKMLNDSFLKDRSDLFVALGVVSIVVMLIVPMPTVALDTLMALNLILALLILLIVLYTRRATEFSVFPTVLLVSTVFGLALNVSSTRLILSKGIKFDGRMVRAFSTFVVGSGGTEGLVIGFVIFIVIIAVQAIVITKGATRVAEVAARFALDALPGKQMAIEAEYNSGAISEEESFKRKNELQREVDFYGAMDGASKFVSGNVKVGILITVINMLGGIIIGMAIHQEPFSTAISTYTALTIGDGLLSQFPSLLVSTANRYHRHPLHLRWYLWFRCHRPILSGCPHLLDSSFFVLGGFALLPGFPWYVLIPLAILNWNPGLPLRPKED
ncbi:hypothetical protein MASR2M78_32100 [Treponema sp.]